MWTETTCLGTNQDKKGTEVQDKKKEQLISKVSCMNK